MQGVYPRTVQKWMGHKDQTILRYAHVSPDHEKAAIERLRYDRPDDTSLQEDGSSAVVETSALELRAS